VVFSNSPQESPEVLQAFWWTEKLEEQEASVGSFPGSSFLFVLYTEGLRKIALSKKFFSLK
jgi:hypothetical protein